MDNDNNQITDYTSIGLDRYMMPLNSPITQPYRTINDIYAYPALQNTSLLRPLQTTNGLLRVAAGGTFQIVDANGSIILNVNPETGLTSLNSVSLGTSAVVTPMITNIATAGTDTNNSSYTTSNLPIFTGKFYLIAIYNEVNSGAANSPIFNSQGYSYSTIISRQSVTDPKRRLTLFSVTGTADGTAPGTITFSGGQTQNGVVWSFSEVSNTLGVIVQSAGVDESGTAVAGITVDLNPFLNSANAAFGVMSWGGGPSFPTANFPFTTLGTTENFTDVVSLYSPSANQHVGWSWQAGPNQAIALAIEIEAVPI